MAEWLWEHLPKLTQQYLQRAASGATPSASWKAKAEGSSRSVRLRADCVMVGGGPGGLTAAVYLARYLRDVMRAR